MNRLLAVGVVLNVLVSAVALAAETPGKYVKVYRGEEGLKVTTVALEGADKGKALIGVTGRAGQFDGLVFKATVLDHGGGSESHVITVEGSDWHLLRSDTQYGSTVFKVYLPEKRDGEQVGYDEKESQKAKPAALVGAFGKMAKNARYQKVITFDRKAKEAAAEKDLATAVDATAKACAGKSPAIKVAWDSVTDDHIKRLSVVSFCGAPLGALESICAADEKLRAKAAGLTTVTCRFGTDLTLKVAADGSATWTTSEAASNQDDFARAVLANELRLR